MTLSHYADLFDGAADKMAEMYVTCTGGADNFYPLVTGKLEFSLCCMRASLLQESAVTVCSHMR